MRRRAFFQLAGLAAAAWPAPSFAQGFPSRAVSLVVPYPAGGPTDTLTRIMGEAMQRPLGQSVLIENVTGASGAIGVTKVARANPDGYTLSIGHASSHITIWAVQPGGFELLRDMTPVLLWAVNPSFLSARRTLEPTTLKELIAWLKANPGKASMGGAFGTMGHIASLELKQRFDDLGQDIPPPEMQTVAALAAFQKAEVERWTPLLKAANLKTE